MNNDSGENKLEQNSRKKIIKTLIAGAIVLIIIVTGFIILLNKDTQINELHVETQRLDEVIHSKNYRPVKIEVNTNLILRQSV